MLIPVILSGGAGTRLWPVSREAHPKPFMVLPDGFSLLQKALLRILALPSVEQVLTLTNREYYFKTRDEYQALKPPPGLRFDYVLEPFGRNTAPAIAMAALRLLDQFGHAAVMLVLPADHLVGDERAFMEAVVLAKASAAEGQLVTFGVRPSYPETGFGYIEYETARDSTDVLEVKRFMEKPDLETARQYIQSGRFLWNLGMFCFRVGTILEALKEHAPAVYDGTVACWEATARESDPVELAAEQFAAVPEISIDYAVMEKASRVVVVPGEFGWNDIGSWDAVSSLVAADEAGNKVIGEAVLIDATNCYVHGGSRLVAVVGVDDLIIVDTPDALLVTHRTRVQDVKRVVERLKSAGHESYRLHRTVHRPWGTYTVLEEGPRFKMKRIVVKPGQSLSLQMHHHRSEHWVVVSGTAKVVDSAGERLVRTDESTYIQAGTPHRLMNPGVIDLVMIEVQTGEYLGEDDIVRIEDQYGRH